MRRKLSRGALHYGADSGFSERPYYDSQKSVRNEEEGCEGYRTDKDRDRRMREGVMDLRMTQPCLCSI